ncbi:Transposase IS4 [Popillia japonica]|uniref:Transposase IS4 n=1 Tax=Popillia japonica TaxID=7064 RepID=A0AAW1LW17_POPJA
MIQEIVDCTNKYIQSIQAQFSRSRDAKITDIIEIKALIGMLYLAGVYHANRLSLDELWSEDGVQRFRKTITLRRFRLIMRCMRFDDIETRDEGEQIDRLAAIRSIFDAIVTNCQKSHSLGQNVMIDEKLEAFRGRYAKVCYSYNMEIYAEEQPAGPYAISNKPVDVILILENTDTINDPEYIPEVDDVAEISPIENTEDEGNLGDNIVEQDEIRNQVPKYQIN